MSQCGSSDPVVLVARVKADGKRLMDANPKQIIVANIVRRVLGIVKDEIEDLRKEGHLPPAAEGSRPTTPQPLGNPSVPYISSPLRREESGSSGASRSPERALHAAQIDAVERSLSSRTPSHRSRAKPAVGPPAPINPPPVSMFDLLAYPEDKSPRPDSPTRKTDEKPKDLLKESLSATGEFMDELDQADDQIASFALDHIHSNEVILTYSSSETVQTFLLKAAAKRKFTVIHVESYPNHVTETHEIAAGTSSVKENGAGPLQRTLTKLGIKVVVVPNSAIFGIMSRVNKVVLSTESVLVNGGLIADAGTGLVANAARVHKVPTVVLCPVYKLSPSYPFEPDALVEYGDPGAVLGPGDLDLVGKMDIVNPLTEYVPPELVDLYITNLYVNCPLWCGVPIVLLVRHWANAILQRRTCSNLSSQSHLRSLSQRRCRPLARGLGSLDFPMFGFKVQMHSSS